MGAFLSSYLNLTPAQQAQEKVDFPGRAAVRAAVRQQLRQTRQSLRAAVQANNTAQIQQLASTEGSELGQLAAIRSTAMAKVYQIADAGPAAETGGAASRRDSAASGAGGRAELAGGWPSLVTMR
jgi:hypothetical protein